MIEKLQEIIQRCTENDMIFITGETILMTDLGLNSIELFQLANEVEEVFNIKIPDRVLVGFRTVQNVLDYIAVHTSV